MTNEKLFDLFKRLIKDKYIIGTCKFYESWISIENEYGRLIISNYMDLLIINNNFMSKNSAIKDISNNFGTNNIEIKINDEKLVMVIMEYQIENKIIKIFDI